MCAVRVSVNLYVTAHPFCHVCDFNRLMDQLFFFKKKRRESLESLRLESALEITAGTYSWPFSGQIFSPSLLAYWFSPFLF